MVEIRGSKNCSELVAKDLVSSLSFPSGILV